MKRSIAIIFLLTFAASTSFCQVDAMTSATAKMPTEDIQIGIYQQPQIAEDIMSEMSLRHIGPAILPGRVGDIAINPKNPNQWYVLYGSGGLWKTNNRGISWEHIFTDGPFSLGCVTIDEKNTDVVWLGTGENEATRSMAFGDGVYKSTDAGQTWKCMGLETSEHIAKILIDPRDSDVVYVASQGPIWSKGGQRGLYKTTDGGQTWEPVLRISADTGVTDIVMDPRDPDVIYAAGWQRRRHVGVLIGGGQEAQIFKTTDGGQSWKMLYKGLPAVDFGRIALAVSPHNPDVVYAAIVAEGNESGFFRSADCGETFVRQSNYRILDPQYYGELYCDPHKFDKLYSVDMMMNYTEDGGKTFQRVNWRMHVDYHALAFDKTNSDYLLVGNDGGLYETFDAGKTWRHFTNMPTYQLYRVSVDNALPFYNVYGGSQDNGTIGGPSRTMNRVGIRTSDWYSVGGGDGMQSRVDPQDANIIYTQSQNGAISRMDLRTGESKGIRPRPDSNTPDVRWNWDTPLIVSPHNASTLYYGGSVLFKSDDRGDNWQAISGDLTRQIDRDTIPVMGQIWGSDAVAKNLYTTEYGICNALSESSIKQGLIYFGTDEGLIQVTENDGKTWTKYDSFPTVPNMATVSDLFASQHDENTVYASFHNYQYGDYTPYLLKSTDKGKTWESIASNLPDKYFLWCIYEDSVNKDLLFAGTEFGLFVTVDCGKNWVPLKSGAAKAAFRDMEIQKCRSDLVCGTFAYGFYILDDITPLRSLTPETLDKAGAMLGLRDAYYYNEHSYVAAAYGNETYPNPPFGAMLTYYLSEDITDANSCEVQDVVLTIAGADANEVSRINGPGTKGIHRVVWNLRSGSGGGFARRGFGGFEQEEEQWQEEEEMWMEEEFEEEEALPASGNDTPRSRPATAQRQRRQRGSRSSVVKPGVYKVVLNKTVNGDLEAMDQGQEFKVLPLPGAEVVWPD